MTLLNDNEYAIIPSKRYEQLKKMESAMEEGKTTLTITDVIGFGGGYTTRSYYTESEIVKEVCSENEKLKETMIQRVNALKDEVNDVCKMSVWQFLKWRKKFY